MELFDLNIDNKQERQEANVCEQNNRGGSVRLDQEGKSQKRIHDDVDIIPPEREPWLQEFKANNFSMPLTDSRLYFIL